MTDHRRKIEELLTRRIGLDPVSLGPHLILRAAERRMSELGVSDLADYASRVDGSEAEQQALIEEVVVPESWFFRDERPFRWLAERVRENWVRAPWKAPFRILSMPCAGGQEPYSIAITLREAGLAASRFRIDAVDVSARMLEIAHRGVYSANAFRSVRGERREARGEEDQENNPGVVGSPLAPRPSSLSYFRPHSTGYEVDPAIRGVVRFVQANVLDPSLLADAAPYDVVFCRNLLIYLDARARAGLLATLDRLLAGDGVLFIGHADRLGVPGIPARFVATGEPGCFAYRRIDRPADRPPEPAWPLSLPMPPTLLILPEPSPFAELSGPTPRAASSSTPPPATAPRADEPARPALDSPALLERAAELANQGRHAEAIAACEQHLRQKGPGAAAYYLLGMICQSAGDRRRAEECFHKTIYLEPRHAEALLALALSAERHGDREAAAGFRRRARRQAGATGDRGTDGRGPAGGER